MCHQFDVFWNVLYGIYLVVTLIAFIMYCILIVGIVPHMYRVFSVFVFKRSPLMDCQNCIWMYLINCHYYLFNEGYIIVSCLFLDVFNDNMAAFLELLCIDLQLLCHIKYCTCNIYIFIEHITGPFDHLHFWLRRWSV